MRSIGCSVAMVAFCGVTVYPMGVLAQQGTDCRQPESKNAPSLTPIGLAGDWKDNSVNLDVTITQSGDQVSAKYKTPYKCAHLDQTTHQPVMLDVDFDGTVIGNTALGASILGDVYICLDTNGGANSSRVKGHLDMTIVSHANSMSGFFNDPIKGKQDISFTRTNPDKSVVYRPGGVITTTRTAKLYRDTNTGSDVKYVVPPGTRLIFTKAILDADGNPVWYEVEGSVGQGSATSRNTGLIQASDITCTNPNPKSPGRNG